MRAGSSKRSGAPARFKSEEDPCSLPMSGSRREGNEQRFETGACVDLGAFDPSLPDAGARAFVDRARGLDWIVIMEDREPDFFHGYRGFDADAPAPLNRHGPRSERWTMGDLRRLVHALKAEGVAPFYGYWLHECAWVDDRHPELLMRTAEGSLWQDRVLKNADFNPMKRLHADPESGVAEGERYHDWAARRYAELARDFGFEGLFLGDGGMGFRRHGHDWMDLRWFDFDAEWTSEFAHTAATHPGCSLEDRASSPSRRARDVREHHWAEWVAWNTERWTAYYRETAEAVHRAGGKLAAYNVMNYDPAVAKLHGVDYRGIAEAGLDVCVFQAYDYAWGPLGPFSWAGIRRKDHDTNLRALLLSRAAMGYANKCKLVVTVETDDSVEHWDCPEPHTLGQALSLGLASAFDGERWRRAADGAFIVWGNAVKESEWRSLRAAFDQIERAEPRPGAALVWRDEDADSLVERALSLASPDEIYAHLASWRQEHEGAPTAVIRESDLARAKWAQHPRRVIPHAPPARAPPRPPEAPARDPAKA